MVRLCKRNDADGSLSEAKYCTASSIRKEKSREGRAHVAYGRARVT